MCASVKVVCFGLLKVTSGAMLSYCYTGSSRATQVILVGDLVPAGTMLVTPDLHNVQPVNSVKYLFFNIFINLVLY